MNISKQLTGGLLGFLGLLAGLPLAPALAGNFGDNPSVREFIDEMVEQHQFDRDTLLKVFSQTQLREDILKAISRPAEGKPWYEYRPIFLTQSRIDGGVEFWRQHAEILARASEAYDVDPAIIVAIIGVETRYGANTGSYRVIDALSTLAFEYPPRSKFFRSELEQFLMLTREEDVEMDAVKGSYAGAMGYGQFIPSSYRSYAVDFNKDGKRDLWHSLEDIIGSVANYFHRHGWSLGEPVVSKVQHSGPIPEALVSKSRKPKKTVADFARSGITATPPLADTQAVALLQLEQKNGPEYWLTTNNFYVITRYNRSPLYAMVVFQLSEAIRNAYQKKSS